MVGIDRHFDYAHVPLRPPEHLLRPESPEGGLRQGSGSRDGRGPVSLHAFRILRLHPGKGNSPLVCNLLVRRLRYFHTSPFEEPEPYDALSYHWGSQWPPRTINILAKDTLWTKDIGEELEAALRQFRHPTEDVHLWVDALCIDQSNTDEKSVQIPLMREIYGHAECVRVWLGTEQPATSETLGSKSAMDFVNECLDDLKAFDKLVKDTAVSQRWAALSELMRRRWFSRRWIIQEIALAQKATVHCGSSSVEWRRFASVIKMLSRREAELRQLFRKSPDFRNHPDYLGDLSELGAIRLADLASHLVRKTAKGVITERKFSLEALMSSLTAFEASDPHDVLYAVLWLAKDAHPVSKQYALETSGRSRAASITSQTSAPTTFFSANSISPQRATFEGGLEPVRELDARTGASNDRLLPPSTTIRRPRTQSNQSALSESSRSGSAQSQNIAQAELNGAPEQQVPEPPVDVRSASPAPSPHAEPPRVRLESTREDEAPTKTEFKTNLKIFNAWQLRTQRTQFVVDYDKSVFEVCRDFLESAIRQSASLDMICKPWAPAVQQAKMYSAESDSGIEILPSWIPQLSGSAFGRTASGVHRRVNADSLVKRLGHHGTGIKPYNAARGHPAKSSFGGYDNKSLFVEGFVLDRVKRKMEAATNGAIPAEWMQAARWISISDSPPDSFWRTLVGNLDAEGMFAPMYWEYSCHEAFKQRPEGGPLDTSDILLDCPSTVQESLERAQRVIWSRRLVLLEDHDSHFLTLAPKRTKKGDLVCILRGCSVPVVLREKKIHSPDQQQGLMQQSTGLIRSATVLHKSYEFVGECYVHDMMDGEAFDSKHKTMGRSNNNKPSDGGDMFETFELR